MDFIHAIILGIVEGITEFLPISSTAHMMIASDFLRLQQTDFVKSFEIFIQLGAIFAVVVIYLKSILNIGFDNIKKLAVAFIPTAIIGFVVYKIVKQFLMGNSWVIVGALFVGGIVLICVERRKKIEDVRLKIEGENANTDNLQSSTFNSQSVNIVDFNSISYKQSFVVGLCQAIAVIPGVSRSAATVIGGMLMGIDRKIIVDFSFLLAIPTMSAAVGLDLLKSYKLISFDQFGVLAVGFVVSFVVAYAVSKWFLKFIKTNNFIVFGWYRIIIAILLALYILFLSK